MDIQIINQDNELYIDSRTVATGFGIEHKSLCKSLQEHFSDLKSLNVCDGGVGRSAKQYLLTERQTMVVPAICRPTEKTIQFQMALVDAFLAMRSKAVALPTDPAEQALMLANQIVEANKKVKQLEGTIEEKQSAIEEMVPQSNFYDSVVATEDWKPLGDFGKVSEIGRNKIYEFCREQKLITYSDKTLVPYQKYVDAGWLYLKEYIFEDAHGEGRRGYKVYVSGKGEAKILGLYHRKRQLDLL